MNLVLFFNPGGRLPSSWRRPESRVEDLYKLDFAIEVAQRAERAGFDALFLADVFYEAHLGRDPFSTGVEPLTLMSALCPVTTQIGLIGTVSTSFVNPYNLARYLASIDHMSKGRVGWNVVTSSAGGEVFGVELPPREERYLRADEFVRVAEELWDAWDDDAVMNDRDSRVWARGDGIHPVNFQGEYFSVQGQLKMPRSPQGRPVIVQAGQSSDGMDFAARHAEVVFTAQTDIEEAQQFYSEVKGRAAALGRDPSTIKILPGIAPIIGESFAAAQQIAAELATLVDMEVGRKAMEITLQGADLTGLPLDAPIPPDRLADPEVAGSAGGLGASRYKNFYAMAVRDKMTLRDLIFESERGLGHSTVTNSVSRVADRFEEWFTKGACDGFAITPVYMPDGLDVICDSLLPELQRRGLHSSEYTGSTLRDHLGLERPEVLRGSEDAPALRRLV
ncbi:NtaA/DmoA family FMN-dependent monooxygenase [Rhodococcus sp. NPDC059968]|uniref:NtaA/DmoA family FMN-dependent monooxygenase n=1 Tax=Rhodococcus sp. NPDC059968 TaxID=3347017 RepID=UPI00366DB476